MISHVEQNTLYNIMSPRVMTVNLIRVYSTVYGLLNMAVEKNKIKINKQR